MSATASSLQAPPEPPPGPLNQLPLMHPEYGDRELTPEYGHALLDRLRSLPAADPAAGRRVSEEPAGRVPIRAPRAAPSKRGGAGHKAAGSKSPGRR